MTSHEGGSSLNRPPVYINSAKKFSSYFLSFESGARLEIMQMGSVREPGTDPANDRSGLMKTVRWGKLPIKLRLAEPYHNHFEFV